MNMRANYYWGPTKGPKSNFVRRAKWSGVHIPVTIEAPADFPFWLKCALPLLVGVLLIALAIVDLATGGKTAGFTMLGGGALLWFGGLFIGGILSLALPVHWIVRRRRIRAVLGHDTDWS